MPKATQNATMILLALTLTSAAKACTLWLLGFLLFGLCCPRLS